VKYYKVTTQAAADSLVSTINANYTYADGSVRTQRMSYGGTHFVLVDAADEQYLTATQLTKLVTYDDMAAFMPKPPHLV